MSDSNEQVEYKYRKNTGITLIFNPQQDLYPVYYSETFRMINDISTVYSYKTRLGNFLINSYDNAETWYLSNSWKMFENTGGHTEMTFEARLEDVSNYDAYGYKRIPISPLSSTSTVGGNGIPQDLPHLHSESRVKSKNDYYALVNLKDNYNSHKRSKIYKKNKDGPVENTLKDHKDDKDDKNGDGGNKSDSSSESDQDKPGRPAKRAPKKNLLKKKVPEYDNEAATNNRAKHTELNPSTIAKGLIDLTKQSHNVNARLATRIKLKANRLEETLREKLNEKHRDLSIITQHEFDIKPVMEDYDIDGDDPLKTAAE